MHTGVDPEQLYILCMPIARLLESTLDMWPTGPDCEQIDHFKQLGKLLNQHSVVEFVKGEGCVFL